MKKDLEETVPVIVPGNQQAPGKDAIIQAIGAAFSNDIGFNRQPQPYRITGSGKDRSKNKAAKKARRKNRKK
jgi:hypothetical protein